MNEIFAQIVPANSFQAADSATTPFSTAPRFRKARSGRRPIFPLDVRRSLQLHHRLVAGTVLIGLALTTIYLLDSWSIPAGQTAMNVQWTPSTVLAASSQTGTPSSQVPSKSDAYSGEQTSSATNADAPAANSDVPQPRIWIENEDEHGSAPDAGNIDDSSRTNAGADNAVSKARNAGDGAANQRGGGVPGALPKDPVQKGSDSGIANLAAVAVAPSFAANFSVVRNAIALLFSFIFFGGMAAVVAHRSDPKVYIGSDVERLIGHAPMALLPDFSEVPDEVVELQLLRLAAGIERTFTARNLRNCVFTGAGRGVGVTTVATRVKELLQTLGKAVVIVDGTGASAFVAGRGEQEAAKQGDPLGVLRQAIEGQSGSRGMVFADSSPLTESAEAEQMVRSADCAIVVIESGVTTRAELRAVAETLQRIKATAVGFVLNRVQLAKADPAFRRSIKEMERELRNQGQNTDWQMLRTLRSAIEEGRASLNFDTGATNQPTTAQPATTAIHAVPFEKILHAEAELTIFEAYPATTAALPGPEPVPSSAPTAAQPAHERIPWPPVETAARFDPSLLWPETRIPQFPQAMSNHSNESESEREMARTAMEGDTRITLPRLSELRGMHFSQALKVLDLTRHPVPPSAEVDVLMRAIAPYEEMFAQAEHGQNGVQQEAADEPLAAMQTFVPVPEQGIQPEAMNGIGNSTADSLNVSSEPIFLPLKPGTPLKRGRKANGNRTRRDVNCDVQIPGGVLDSVQILPSQRGQYKRGD